MTTESPLRHWGFRNRRLGDFILFCVTSVELALLCVLTPTFTLTDWIYVLSNVVVLVIALTRRPAQVQDNSIAAAAAVFVSYTYTYAQVAYLRWVPGEPAWPEASLILVIAGACLSLASLLSLGRSFGVRPALRGVASRGPYRIVRHPLYLAYIIADIGYNLQEWNYGTLTLVAAGWISMLYRIHAEERVLSADPTWADFTARVRYRLLPLIW
jgi:protein-S-isoprenylcysteine O-methyltransferase Ste14